MRISTKAIFVFAALSAIAPRAHASLIRDLTVCTTEALVTTASLFGDGLILFTAPAEIVGAAAYGAATANKQDPPDLTNYAIRANNSLIVPATPPISGVDAAFTSAETAYIDAGSVMVQDAKNIFDTFDRLAGAQLVGTPTDVANQTIWLGQFNAQLVADFPQYQASLLTLANYFQAELPAAYNYVPPLSSVIATNTQEAAGNFPANEQAAFAAFGFSASQIGYCEACFQNTTAAALTALGPLSFGQAFRDSVTPVPEPSGMLLAASSAILFFALLRRT